MSLLLLSFFTLPLISLSEQSKCISALIDLPKNKTKLALMLYHSGHDINDFGDQYACEQLGHTRFIVLVAEIQSLSVGIGICGPKECEAKDYESKTKTLNSQLSSNYLSASKLIEKDSIRVFDIKKNDTKALSGLSVACLIIIYIILGLVFIGTAIEYYFKDNHPKILKILICFSLISNLKKLFSFPKEQNNLSVFNGIRVISMLYICFSHNYSYSFTAPSVNPLHAYDILKAFWPRIHMFPFYMVDMFFAMSGFLVAYLSSVELKKRRGKLNWFLFYSHRLIRICPVYFFALLVFMSLFREVGSGSIWPMMWMIYERPCEYWWSNLLFISNIIPDDTTSCMGWSWFIANDMQFYLISPIILIIHYRNKRIAYYVLAALISASWVFIFVQSYVNDYNPGIIYGITNTDQFLNSYQKPYTRIVPYLIGLAYGFLYREYDNKKQKAQETEMTENLGLITWEVKKRHFEVIAIEWVHSRPKRIFTYVIASGIMLVAPFITYEFDQNGPDYWSKFLKSLYLACEHTVISFVFVWWLVPFTEGYGGAFARFLASKYFAVAARISFSFYLVHPMVILFSVYNRPDSHYISHFTYLYPWISTVVISAFFAVILSACVEAPILSIEGRILRRKS